MPAAGSTSMFGMLRAAFAKFASTSLPAMMSAEVRPSFSRRERRPAVLASLDLRLLEHEISEAFDLAESACASASARTFLGISCAWLRGRGPKALPPPRNWGAPLSE